MSEPRYTQNAVLGCNLRKDSMISICFQGKSFNTTVIQVCKPMTKAKEAEVKWFCEDLQELLELTLKEKKKSPFLHRGLECKSRKSRDNRSNRHKHT